MSKFAALALEVDKPSRMVIVHPVSRQPLRDKDGNEAYIELFSSDSERSRKHDRAVAQRSLEFRGARSAADLEADAVELLAQLTAGWRLLDLEGKTLDVPFTLENARELYREPALAWLYEQVNRFTGDRRNFSKALSGSSSNAPAMNSGKAER